MVTPTSQQDENPGEGRPRPTVRQLVVADQVWPQVLGLLRSRGWTAVRMPDLAEDLPTYALQRKLYKVRCPDETCTWCAPTGEGGLTPEDECTGCGVYGETGMHWDTCPNRIRSAPPEARP